MQNETANSYPLGDPEDADGDGVHWVNGYEFLTGLGFEAEDAANIVLHAIVVGSKFPVEDLEQAAKDAGFLIPSGTAVVES